MISNCISMFCLCLKYVRPFYKDFHILDLIIETCTVEQLASSVLMTPWLDDSHVNEEVQGCHRLLPLSSLHRDSFTYLSFHCVWLRICEFCNVPINNVIVCIGMPMRALSYQDVIMLTKPVVNCQNYYDLKQFSLLPQIE